MFSKGKIYFLIITILALLLVPACGDGDDEDNPPTATATAAPTATATATPTATAAPTETPVSTKPVKIGAINAWSGAAAMSGTFFADPVIKFVEDQIKKTDGILGGRPLEIVKCDGQDQAALAAGCAKRLLLQDKVSVLAFGGISSAQFLVVADEAESSQVLFVPVSPPDDIAKRKFTVSGAPTFESNIDSVIELVTKTLKPESVGFLVGDTFTFQKVRDGWKQGMEAAGIKVVFSDTTQRANIDFAPQLTKIKYANPDVLCIIQDSEQSMVIARQIMELGGWGDIQVVGLGQSLSAAKIPGAEGWIIVTPWNPGGGYPASTEFEQAYQAFNGKAPTSNHMYFYVAMLTVVEAIKQAGTDNPLEIGQFARSGKLEFDTPMGMAHYGSDGSAGLKPMYVQVQKGGKTVPFKR